jgi:hypothetical protein
VDQEQVDHQDQEVVEQGQIVQEGVQQEQLILEEEEVQEII